MYSIISPLLLRRMHIIVAGTERWRRRSIQSAHTGYGCKWRSRDLDGSVQHVARGTPTGAQVKMNENFLLATFAHVDRIAGWIFALNEPIPNRYICRSNTPTKLWVEGIPLSDAERHRTEQVANPARHGRSYGSFAG